MNEDRLTYYESAICEKLSFIEPHRIDWGTVSTAELQDLKDYLANNWYHFKDVMQKDIANGCASASSIISIYRSFKKYTRWYAKLQNLIETALESSETSLRTKAEVALEVIELIEIVWVPLLHQYRPLQEELNRKNELLSASEKRQLLGATKEEEKRAADRRILFGIIKGDFQEDKQKKFDILYECIHGLGGKEVAKYLEAAVRLGWLVDKPPFALMQTYWDVQGGAAAISKVYSGKGGSLVNEKLLENAMQELSERLNRQG